ncbi:hypothetical protein ACFL00_04805 [Pseudomonadota bacterium]
MFVGHYAAGLALKKFEKGASLGVLFLAVQFVDIVFFPLVLLGVERLNFIENYTPSTHFELEYMPFTHSLLATLFWSGAAYALFRWVWVKKNSVAVVIAFAVFSHWILDLIVHTPDLPLWSDASTKFGLGLWNHPVMTYALEAILLLGGLWLYLSSTSATSNIGKYGMAVFVLVLLLVNVLNIFGPLQGDSKLALSIAAITSYLLFAGVAFWLDKKRT